MLTFANPEVKLVGWSENARMNPSRLFSRNNLTAKPSWEESVTLCAFMRMMPAICFPSIRLFRMSTTCTQDAFSILSAGQYANEEAVRQLKWGQSEFLSIERAPFSISYREQLIFHRTFLNATSLWSGQMKIHTLQDSPEFLWLQTGRPYSGTDLSWPELAFHW